MKISNSHIILMLFTALILLDACIDEDYFGLSGAANITIIEVANQASPAVINADQGVVQITFPNGIDLTQVELRKLELSSFASTSLQTGTLLDFSTDVLVIVTAEDGTSRQWTITPEVATDNPQLTNSNFNEWYKTGGNYFEPGTSAETTIWGTGNPGTQLLNLFATTPLDRQGEDKAARLETLSNGSFPAGLGFPISAGTIYTGKFNSANLDPTDPRAAIDFGTNFSGRPNSFEIEYSYAPGSENKDKSGAPLPYGDACDIYVLLEVRTNNDSRRLATAWFRSDEAVPDLTTIEVGFTYGELDNSFPDYMRPANDKYVSADSAAFILPTHLTFVGTSSFEGDLFNGAVGSTLILDNLEFIYEE